MIGSTLSEERKFLHERVDRYVYKHKINKYDFALLAGVSDYVLGKHLGLSHSNAFKLEGFEYYGYHHKSAKKIREALNIENPLPLLEKMHEEQKRDEPPKRVYRPRTMIHGFEDMDVTQFIRSFKYKRKITFKDLREAFNQIRHTL